MLTGKAKEDFEKWYKETKPLSGCGYNDMYSSSYEYFEELPISMQYGVYVDWFDSVGLKITFDCSRNEDEVYGHIQTLDSFEYYGHYKTRTEARQKAIEKANEIYNLK